MITYMHNFNKKKKCSAFTKKKKGMFVWFGTFMRV